MKLDDFNYNLPDELIAANPLAARDASQLLVVGNDATFSDKHFADIIDYLQPNDLLVLNNTRVVKARLFGNKLSGGKVEIMLERVVNNQEIIAHVRTSKAIKLGMQVLLADGLIMEVIELLDGLFRLKILRDIDIYAYLETYGNLPLPPYMHRQAEQFDEERYQTVYAEYNGSVAAPTAGLHFTAELIKKLESKGIKIAYVTLHVGSGTFKPVSVENIAEHKMHSEVFTISQATIDLIQQTKQMGARVIAVGTTSMRTLESVAKLGMTAQSGETDIFITPGFEFQVVDMLITNFHLPKSTLLMLVSAFSGFDLMRKAYQYAIEQRYRFFSYGDAMLLTRHCL